jgi:hypothetical protein
MTLTLRLRRTVLLLVAVYLSSFYTAVSATADVPIPIQPVGGSQIILGELRPGQWVPCLPGWASTDCVEGIAVGNVGDSLQPLEFIPNPLFQKDSATQTWTVGNDFWWPNNIRPGYWRLPSGFSLSDGSNLVNAVVWMNQGFGFLLNAASSESADLSPNTVYEITFRGQNLQKYFGNFRSNSHDPVVAYPDSTHATFTLQPATSYRAYGHTCDQLASDNTIRADSSRIWVEGAIVLKSPDESSSPPTPVIMGTNGFWCFTEFGWDPTTMQISVKLGTSHLDDKGQVISGWSEIRIKGSAARAWWGIDPRFDANSARVEISYPDGSAEVATTTVSYDPVTDWIYLRSSGFHYSTPTLRVSFAQSVPLAISGAVATVSPIPKVIQARNPTKSRTCIRGKITKKIVGTNPKCPKGYILKK